ncbi:pyridoxal phosphate-dependent aminotransferase [Virgibacillus sp. 179-BFC.A HS]|uniref:Aminotransferase n=1 Tax=Tigheibacillus jepli TaxID=3035914 RepID=A0ABU5CHA0_9BACI|nr:pyridoxal phosphate-dependent aminotransferase [Virgibacillus sp. 179-BFC.A HS]MDY0405724.1 pyridoxal phosphate-dependent aminotransferase [Virgibacillus sp. 179-BFC.A HS]
MELATRVQSLTPSSTLAISAKAKVLKEQGKDVIGLGVGEPDFNTPAFINEAAIHAIHDGKTKYTPASGLVELKKAIAHKLEKDNGLSYGTDQIIITNGAKHALYTLFQVILNQEDEVIIPAPYWVSYPEQVKLAQGNPVFVQGLEENDFKITPEQLEKAITNKTKALIINSPSNPTGMMYHQSELKKLAEVCLKHDVLIISDEIYEKLIYTADEHISVASISSEIKENTVVINGVSKSHAMTGWRIGYAAGPAKLIKAMSDHASHATSNPNSIAQYAALAAYQSDEDPTVEMRKIFKDRLDTFFNLLAEIPGIHCKKPKGAFYLFPNVKEAARAAGYVTVDEWAEALLEEENVALVPGSGFGAPDNVRLSYATSKEVLIDAANRIKRFVNKQTAKAN